MVEWFDVFEVPSLSLVLQNGSADRLSWFFLGFEDECFYTAFIYLRPALLHDSIKVVQVDDTRALHLKRRR